MSAQIISFRIERQDDGELRISETELGEKLGYSRGRDFRRIVKKHRARIDRMGSALRRRETSGDLGGRPAIVEWFTEQQAIFLASRSETDVADDIMEAVAIQFVEMRRALNARPITRDLLRLNILSPEVRIWERRFEKPFFVHLHRVLGLEKTGRNNHPNCGHFINRYVYEFLFGDMGIDIIREANPKVLRKADDGTAEYHRAFRHHQMLKVEHMDAFNQHIRTLNTLLGISTSVGHFDDIFNATFPKPLTQIGFMFNEARRSMSSSAEAQ